MNMVDKSIHTLELPTVLSLLANCAVNPAAKEICRTLRPSTEPKEVERLHNETSAAIKMMELKGSPAIYQLQDIRPSISRAVLGGTLNTLELLEIARCLQCARLLKSYIADNDEKSCIDSLFFGLQPNKHLEEKISDSIAAENEITDSASSELAAIRRKMRAASARARDTLQKIISSPEYAKHLQENIITMRGDRYVIPVKADHRSAIPGLVHDLSSTGMTVFIEPMGVVKANNELKELAAEEKNEIERILGLLTSDCANYSEEITEDFAYIVKLDIIFARAKLAYNMEAFPADISDRKIMLLKAKHPLIPKEHVVANDIELGNSFDTLVITGPNTGGKTVSLKTIGLLALMNQCGLHIPAAEGSCLPIYDKILADIGDEQSIEQNLSTFSAHMANIVEILNECDSKSLLLFDELGAGTDPAEGAALAVSIIEHAREEGCTIAATTHYTELKIYATNTSGVQNASCEFDVQSLSPTYKLLIGIPGKSNAFAISRRLGLREDIIHDAESRIGEQTGVFEATIEKLEATRKQLENERDEAAKARHRIEEDVKKSAYVRAELELRLQKADVKSKREAERILADARRTAEETFAELDEMRRKINDKENAAELNAARTELRHKLNKREEEFRENSMIGKTEPILNELKRAVQIGDTVFLKKMGINASVQGIGKDETLKVLVGQMIMTVAQKDAVPVEPPVKKEKKHTASAGTALSSAVSPEIDLRGMESIDAVLTAEQYLDSAVMSRLPVVTIIHGKGTGALRIAIHNMLRKNKLVKSFRLGSYGEGETGVTIVELK